METVRFLSGWKKVGSRIRDKHPGSATLLLTRYRYLLYLCVYRYLRCEESCELHTPVMMSSEESCELHTPVMISSEEICECHSPVMVGGEKSTGSELQTPVLMILIGRVVSATHQ